MPKLSYKTWLWAGLLLLPWVAHAAGLGRLTILSALGQPLLAEIELITGPEDARATLNVRIASPEAFAKANIQYSPALFGTRLSIERRSDGRPYIKVISTRSVNEPFIDLLVELSWEQGQLLREYTALLDPPGYASGAPIVQAAPAVEPAPAVTPESQALAPTVPVEAKPAAAPAATRPAAPAVTPESQALAPAAPVKAKPRAKAPAVARAAASPRVEGKEYGPVKRGDTLSRIAARVKPEGVTLEQMLASLYHANRAAFGDNMNVLYAGAMLRIPEEHEVAAIAQSKAAAEVRAREAGKDAPMDVLRLSKGELADSDKTVYSTAASRRMTERLRKLEVEVDALEKALTKANALVVQLEQTIKIMRRRIAVTEELPGLPAAGTLPQAALGDKPGAVPPVTGDRGALPELAGAEPAKTEPPKMEPARDAGQMTAEAPQPAAVEPPQAKALKAEAPKPGPAVPAQPAPAKIVQAPPDMIDQILAEPLYLAGGGLLALLGGVGYAITRRRRTSFATVEPHVAIAEPHVATVKPRAAAVEPRVATVDARIAAAEPRAATAETQAATVAAHVATVDLLAEAKLFLKFGRDERAEEILIEVIEGDPANEEAQLKLLEIYAERKDKAAFEKIARKLHAQTAAAGDSWLKTAAMGYALDPENPLYETSPTPATPAAQSAAVTAGADVESPPPASTVTETETKKAEPDAGDVDRLLAAQLEKLTRPAEAQDTARDAVAAPAAPAAAEVPLQFAAPEITLDFPGGVQPTAAPDKTPAAPEGEAAKTAATENPAEPLIGTIEFETSLPAPAPATTGVKEDAAAPLIGTIDFETSVPAPAKSGDDKNSK